METFGQQPTNETDENKRLQTHLNYVEKLLRRKDISSLTKDQKENRHENPLFEVVSLFVTTLFPKVEFLRASDMCSNMPLKI